MRRRYQNLEERTDHGHLKGPDSRLPIEMFAFATTRLTAPEYPCGEQTIEEGLHQRTAKEMLTPVVLFHRGQFTFKSETERLLQRLAHVFEFLDSRTRLYLC